MCDMVTLCEKNKITELKAGLLMRRFRSGVFCGKDELPLVRTLTFLTFKSSYMHKNQYETMKGRKLVKKSPFK